MATKSTPQEPAEKLPEETQPETLTEVPPSASAPPVVSFSIAQLEELGLLLPPKPAEPEPLNLIDVLTVVQAIWTHLQAGPMADAAPKLPTVKSGDGLLRVNYALLDSNGVAFGHDLDIPLPGFTRPSMLPMAIKTIQATLSTLVLSPLYGAITDYVESCAAGSAHLEVPLPFRLKGSDRSDSEAGEPGDLEDRGA